MKRNHLKLAVLLVLLLSLVFVTAITAYGEETETPQTLPAGVEDAQPQGTSDEQTGATLEKLLGEDYVEYVTETITMQMGNRMEKNPEVRYFPIEEKAPLGDYVDIGADTEFTVDEDGNPVIHFPAGTVTEAENGEQSFRIPKLYQ